MTDGTSDDILRYRALVDSMNEGFGVVDKENVFTYVNKRLAAMLQYSPTEMVGKPLQYFLDEKNKATLKENVQKRSFGEASQYELEWMTKSGELVPTIVSGAPLVNEQGKYLGSFAVITDITERRKFEKELADSETRYRTLVDTSPDAIILADLRGKIVFANKRIVSLFGEADETSFLGRHILQLVSDDDRPRAEELYRRKMELGEVRIQEYRLVRKDGTTFPAETRFAQVLGSDGRPSGFVAVATDVTERKRVEAAIIESEERYRLLYENLSDGLFQTNMQGEVIMCSERAAEMIGTTPEGIIGRSFITLLHPDDREWILEAFRSGFEEMETEATGYEARGVRDDGSVFDFHVTNTILTEDGKPIGYQSLIRNISARKIAEEARRESEEKYRALAENSLQGLTVIQGQNYVYANNAFARMVGYTVEELLALSSDEQWALIHHDDQQYLLDLAEDRREGRPTPTPYEYRLVNRDGTLRWVAAFSNYIEYGGDKALQVGLIDITERKLAEDALKQSESKYRVLAEQSLQGLAIMQDEGIVYVNQAYSDLVGYSIDELLEFNTPQVWEMIHEDDQARLKQRFRDYMKSKEIGPRNEYRIKRKDGQIRYVESYVSIVDFGGKPAMQTVLVDITERRDVQETLLKSEVKYRTLAEQSLQGLTILQDDGLVYVNKAFANLASRRVDELLGLSLMDIWGLFHADDRGDLRQRILDRLAGRESPPRSEYRLLSSEGEIKWVETYASTIEFAGEPAVQTVFVDVTDRKIAERELRSAKDRAVLYLDLMGHDIRNQLQVIMSSAALLRSATDDSIKESFMDVIAKSVQRCSRMIEEAKETEHLLAAPLIGRSLMTSLDACIQAISTRVQDAEFIRNYETTEAIVTADTFLELLLTNLLINAIEHNPSDDKKVWITISQEDGGFVVAIGDNGSGISDTMKEDLFEMSRRYGGLGLHQSMQILDKYQGKVEVLDRVAGKPEEGAEFRVWFPKME